ncbi:FAD-binding oxidoreductase [Kocuria atrinae]|uniref:FAD-binding oxidoreductase n=1 Tax=Kocuria atrinae TaxID=592377 RepID=UPI00031FDB22|nr:FAD-binding oxidoreductase [Kocuria atrinae]
MNEQSATPDEPTESSDLTAKVAKDTWRSWGRNLTVTPAAIVRPENTDQVEQVLRDASAQGLRVRPAGSGQSFSPLVPTSDVVLDATALTGLSSIDVEKQQATFFGGTTIQQISQILEDHGLALGNMPDFTGQTIAGAIATAPTAPAWASRPWPSRSSTSRSPHLPGSSSRAPKPRIPRSCALPACTWAFWA